jgi:hypothetical protein
MHALRQVGKGLPPGAAHTLPVFHRGLASLSRGLCLLALVTVWWGDLQHLQTLPCLLKGLLGLPQTTKDGQRIPLGQIMAQVTPIRNAQTAQTRVGELDQCLGAVTHQG